MILDKLARFLLVRQIRQSFYTWDAERLQHHQQKRLGEILKHVSQHSPYYKELRTNGWDGSFASLPLLSKSELVTQFDQVNTAGLRKADLFDFAIRRERGEPLGLYRGRYSVGLSSGTSGIRLPTVLSASERWQYGSLLFARSGIPESIRQPRVLFALRVNNPAFMEVRFLGVSIFHADYTRPIEDIVRLINEKTLNVLAGPPSLLRLISQQRQQIDHPIQALISYAEVLDDKTRQQLQADFQAPLAQIYQGAEGFIASTCRAGSLHLNEDVVLVETLESGDTVSHARRLVVTDLHRKTLPFLRYQLNDIVEFNPEPCSCGSVFRCIERIHGRADDIFHLRSREGEVIRFLFPDYVTRSINQASEEILEFQAIQHNLDSLEIRLHLQPNAARTDIETRILHNLEYWAQRVAGRLGTVTFSDELPERNSNSLKLIRVVRRF
jgi:putative adenylate-forming enzyme